MMKETTTRRSVRRPDMASGADQGWFAPKAYGFGAGVPIAWQGWAATGAFFALVAGAAVLLLPDSPLPFAMVTLAGAALVVVIAALKTKGGWRWRWGSEA